MLQEIAFKLTDPYLRTLTSPRAFIPFRTKMKVLTRHSSETEAGPRSLFSHTGGIRTRNHVMAISSVFKY